MFLSARAEAIASGSDCIPPTGNVAIPLLSIDQMNLKIAALVPSDSSRVIPPTNGRKKSSIAPLLKPRRVRKRRIVWSGSSHKDASGRRFSSAARCHNNSLSWMLTTGVIIDGSASAGLRNGSERVCKRCCSIILAPGGKLYAGRLASSGRSCKAGYAFKRT